MQWTDFLFLLYRIATKGKLAGNIVEPPLIVFGKSVVCEGYEMGA
jgi:hypothetical protein